MESRDELQEHMETHKEKNGKNFVCAKCSFKTKVYGDFRRHIDSHLHDESEPVSSTIELPNDWTKDKHVAAVVARTVVFCPEGNPPPNVVGADQRQASPGAFNFARNVASFKAKKRGGESRGGPALAALKQGVTMTPVTVKEELMDDDHDVKPDVGAMQEQLMQESLEATYFAEDVKPDVKPFIS